MSMRRALAVTIAIAAVGLAGCGGNSGGAQTGSGSSGSGSAGAPVQAVKAAYATTTGTQTAKLTMDQQFDVGKRAISIDARGKVDFAKQLMRLTVQDKGRNAVQLRKVGQSMYVQYPPQAPAKLPKGKTWVAIDLSKIGKKQYGATYSQMQPGLATNPTQPLSFLKGVSDAHKVGPATVAGIRTTHYKVKVDLQRLSDRMDPADRRGLQTLKQRLGSDTLPLDLWLDGQGRVRKEQMHLQFTTPAGTKASIDTTIRLAGFGTPVQVDAPPQGKTTDLGQVLASRG